MPARTSTASTSSRPRRCGRTAGNLLRIARLDSDNQVPAIRNQGFSGSLVLVDSSVGEGQAGSPSQFQEELRRNRRKVLNDFVKAIFKTPRSAGEIKTLVDGAMRMPLEASLSLFPSHVLREHWRETVVGYTGPLLYAVTPQFAEQARQLRNNRPGTRIEMFEKAGHALFVDEAERFNRLLGEFIDKTIVPGRTEE